MCRVKKNDNRKSMSKHASACQAAGRPHPFKPLGRNRVGERLARTQTIGQPDGNQEGGGLSFVRHPNEHQVGAGANMIPVGTPKKDRAVRTIQLSHG